MTNEVSSVQTSAYIRTAKGWHFFTTTQNIHSLIDCKYIYIFIKFSECESTRKTELKSGLKGKGDRVMVWN